jgi:hypothetical protein
MSFRTILGTGYRAINELKKGYQPLGNSIKVAFG